MSTARSGQMANSFDPNAASAIPPERRAMIERRTHLLGPAYRLFYTEPLHFVRGEGVYLYDADGTPYLDVYNNVASVGHCHPHVVDAITRQTAVLVTHTRYLHDGILDYAERLLATFPAPIGHLMLTCTGSEANDLAIRIAKAATGNTGFIVTQSAYHGVTGAVAEMSPSLGAGVPLGLHVRMVPPPRDGGAAFTAGVRAAIDDLALHGQRPAALLCDSIFSSDGVFADPPGFLAAAVDAVRAAGGIFIADEVQPGFGRTGDAMWGFARHGVVPELVSMGKPMGNGYPVAGLAMQPDLIAEFGRRARYFNTFGGNPVACAAASAVLDVIEDEGLVENSARVGAVLREGVQAMGQRYAAIGEVRGAGLFVGADIVDAAGAPDGQRAAWLVNALRERRVLISCTGPHAHTLKIRPPLVFSEAHVDEFLDALESAMAAMG
jgi:4-aminobutyrate aminotransferase-like enzyme